MSLGSDFEYCSTMILIHCLVVAIGFLPFQYLRRDSAPQLRSIERWVDKGEREEDYGEMEVGDVYVRCSNAGTATHTHHERLGNR